MPRHRLITRIRAVIALAWLALLPVAQAADKPWYPVEIDVWSPPFNADHQHTLQQYTPPTSATKPWRICAVIPHLKDDYWLAVNYGLVEEAKRLGVALNLYEAGAYENVDIQRRQITDCITQKSDAIIIGAVSATALNDLVDEAAGKGIPVIDMINGINSQKITARVAADFYDMGYAAGTYLKKVAAAKGGRKEVAWFPGPSGAGWVAAGNRGFRQALDDSDIEVVSGGFGDTGLAAQTRLVNDMLANRPEIDFIAGTAVTAEAAVQILQRQKLGEKIGVIAYYFGPTVSRAIKRGSILAAPTDRQTLLARMSVDQAVYALEGRPVIRHIAATIKMIDSASIADFDLSESLAPLGFRPIFSVNQ